MQKEYRDKKAIYSSYVFCRYKKGIWQSPKEDDGVGNEKERLTRGLGKNSDELVSRSKIQSKNGINAVGGILCESQWASEVRFVCTEVCTVVEVATWVQRKV